MLSVGHRGGENEGGEPVPTDDPVTLVVVDDQRVSRLDVDQRLRLDVTDQASVDAAIAQAGEISVLVSNAGAIFRRAGRRRAVGLSTRRSRKEF